MLRGCSNVSGTNWRDSLSKPRDIGSFLVLALSFPPIPPKNWGPHSVRNYFLRIGIEKGYPLKKFLLDKLKITVSISNCKRLF